MGRFAVYLAVIFLSSCGGNLPPPDPTPTPTPLPPHTEACQALLDQGLPWCGDTVPPMACGDCLHNPSSDPRHCEKAPDCPVDPPPVDPVPQCPTFTDRGGTLRVLGDACDCWIGQEWNGCPTVPGCAEEPNLVASTCFRETFGDEVKKATITLGDRCGTFWKENLDALAEQLRVQMPSRCVISGIEAVFIEQDDGKYAERHAVHSGTGCWTNSGRGKWIGCHINTGGTTPPPPVDPPPAGDCPAPHPDLGRMKFKVKDGGGDLDTTWTTVNQEPFCAEIGMSPMADGTPRAGCPVRPEGNPERPICEAELCDQKWECNGAPEENENPAVSSCRGHWKTWCSAPGSTAAAEGER